MPFEVIDLAWGASRATCESPLPRAPQHNMKQ